MIALLIAAAAWGWGTDAFDGWPPERFTGDASGFVHFVSPAKIIRRCSDGKPDPAIEACSYGPPNEIYAPNPCSFPRSDTYARLMCHELGHLNSWPSNHPR